MSGDGAPMRPADYDAWYQTPRGKWIGEAEYSLLRRMLGPREGERLLDIGCGTGYFTRRFAAGGELAVTGLDANESWLEYAKAHAAGTENYVTGSATALPFPAKSFDLSISVTALCFVREQQQALREMLRVTGRRFAIGLLNRTSLLYWRKGRHGGSGGYHGAHWHTIAEIRGMFEQLPVKDLDIRTAVFLPGGGRFARYVESVISERWPVGSFIAVAGEVVNNNNEE